MGSWKVFKFATLLHDCLNCKILPSSVFLEHCNKTNTGALHTSHTEQPYSTVQSRLGQCLPEAASFWGIWWHRLAGPGQRGVNLSAGQTGSIRWQQRAEWDGPAFGSQGLTELCHADVPRSRGLDAVLWRHSSTWEFEPEKRRGSWWCVGGRMAWHGSAGHAPDSKDMSGTRPASQSKCLCALFPFADPKHTPAASRTAGTHTASTRWGWGWGCRNRHNRTPHTERERESAVKWT